MKITMSRGWEEHMGRDVQDMLQGVADDIVSDAQSRAPVDSGALRDSISAEVDETGARISANVEYAAEVEMGTSTMRAQPYLRPALYTERNV